MVLILQSIHRRLNPHDVIEQNRIVQLEGTKNDHLVQLLMELALQEGSCTLPGTLVQTSSLLNQDF